MLPLRFSKSSPSSFSLRHALPQSVQNTASTQFRLPPFASRYTSFVGRLLQRELLNWRRDLNAKLPRFTLGNKTGLGIQQFKAYELKGSLVSGCLLMSTSPSGCGHSCPYAVKLDAPNAMDGLKELSVINELENALGTPFNTGPQVAPPKPLVIVISGPSGVGKDAVIKKLQLLRKELHFVVTATTRPKRPGEVDGVDYYFITKNEFQGLIERNELLEHAVVYGDYKGIPKQQVREYMAKGMDVVLRVDVQGAATVRSILGSNAVFIFLVAESEFALVRRLTQRKTETLEKMVVRVSTAREELQRMKEFDYVVVNADKQLDNTVNTICSIIDAEKSRVQQRLAVI